jgi:RHS repeat-associated protein
VGNALAGSLVANRLGFTGQEFDSATATNAFFFRNYIPELGVFQQRDLIGYGDGMGLYQYVHNNPANGVDILGLRDCNENPTSNPNLEILAEIETDLSWINAISSSYEMKVANQFGDLKKLTSDLNVLNKEIQQVNKNLNELASLAKQHKALVDASMNIALKHNNIKTALSLISKAGHIAEGHGGIQGIQKAINAGGSKLGSLKQTASGMANAQGKLKFLKGLGSKLNVLDVGMKGAKLLNTFSDGKSQMTDQGMAAADLVQSATAFTPPGALYNLIDFAQSKLTGKSINQHISDESNLLFDDYYQKQADQADQEYIEYLKSVGKFEDYLNARKKVKNRVRNPNCPQNGSNGGTRRPSPYPRDPQSGTVQILGSYDPNEIIGPVGQPDKRWVSVKDRLPYTINFENDTIATAPAKAVRITAPIHPKMDASTLELGSFGFNSLSFNIPSGTSAYYQRLDCRDSLGIFVDITAGFDVVNNQVFWLLQSIDPVSLQTPTDPLKGLLLLQDTANPTYGHGFANFIIKPQQSAVTLDSILADAVIIFDENEPIPTNVERNTIDAFAPNSQLSTLPATSPMDIHLNWSGQDDPDGSGIRFYTLYASTDGVNFNIVRTNITRTDTVITGQSGLTYHFFVLATDSVGNTEKLLPGAIQSTFVGAPLPATWLSFTGTNQGTDNLLRWATANERNVKAFQLERSLDATSFKTITKQKPNGGLGRQGNYQHLDERVDRLKTDALYYRVKMVDNDGSSNYSSIIKIAIRQEIITKTVVYPNPTRSQITIAVGSEELVGTSAVILDNRGRAIKQIILSSNNHVLNLDSLPAGMYYIRLKNGEVLKVIKQ